MKKTTQQENKKATLSEILSQQVAEGKIDKNLLAIGMIADKKNNYSTSYLQEVIVGMLAVAYQRHENTCELVIDQPQLATQVTNKLNYNRFTNSYMLFVNKEYIDNKFVYTFKFNIELKPLNNWLAKELNDTFIGLNLEPLKETLDQENRIKQDELSELNCVIASCGYEFIL